MSHPTKTTREFFPPSYLEIEIAIVLSKLLSHCSAPGPPLCSPAAEFSLCHSIPVEWQLTRARVALSDLIFIERASPQIGKAGPELSPDKS